MPLQIDWENGIIEITSPTTTVDSQTLHDFIEDEMASSKGMCYSDIIKPEGKIEDPSNPGIYSQIIIIINSPWQIQFWGGSGYTRIYGAKIVGGLNDQPMKASGTAGDITVLESPVDGLTVISGSGITEQDKTDIIDGVWDEVRLGTYTMEDMVIIIQRMLHNKVSKSGDVITIYEEDENTVWKTFDLADGGRVEI
jgi:hypothetical protein